MDTNHSILTHIAAKVKEILTNAEAGHDWLHIERVWRNTLEILETESKADSIIVQLAALLHDVADAKFHNGDESIGPKVAMQLMSEIDIDHKVKQEVILIIDNLSYKGGFTKSGYHSLELDIVRDADRLDAIGAIGIARAFNYGGYKNRRLYDANVLPQVFDSREAYKNHDGPTIYHFFEKLLKLKDLMGTQKGRSMAEERHQFMVDFLEHFYSEVGLDQNNL